MTDQALSISVMPAVDDEHVDDVFDRRDGRSGETGTAIVSSSVNLAVEDFPANCRQNGTTAALRRENVSILSPLRYPGAKRRLASYIRRAVEINDIQPALFVEPFAGGCSVSLQLLNDGVVGRVGLIDLDPLVAAFWETAFFDAEWLIDAVRTVEITLERWYLYKRSMPVTTRDRALACLFLNRTSFSGILAPSAGPIGGRQQTSAYRLDCRFPRETLVRRINQLASLRDRVAFVWNMSWEDSLRQIADLQRLGNLEQDVFYYFDPPFFQKAERLYTFFFRAEDHKRLHDALLQLDAPWILSYDSVNHVQDLYGTEDKGPTHVEVLHSTSSSGGSRPVQEAVITNLPLLPGETRLWQRSAEWKSGGKPSQS